MTNEMAEIISRKVSALKNCNKVLAQIEKNGSAVIKVNCTGLSFTVNRGDAVYLTYKAMQSNLIREIGDYEIVQRSQQGARRYAPAPMGASDGIKHRQIVALSEKEISDLEKSNANIGKRSRKKS